MDLDFVRKYLDVHLPLSFTQNASGVYLFTGKIVGCSWGSVDVNSVFMYIQHHISQVCNILLWLVPVYASYLLQIQPCVQLSWRTYLALAVDNEPFGNTNP